MGVALAIGAVAAAGAVGSAVAQRNAAKKAAQAQKNALDSVSGVDIDELKKEALKADREKFKNQFDLQEEFDPTVAAVREKSATNILASLQDDPGSNTILNQLKKEGSADSPKRQALINQLIDGAEAELAAGATLPPSFQAELVRAGLEQTGGAGLSADYRSASGAHTRKLLGTAGIELQAHRRAQAAQLLDTADMAKQNRLNALSGTLGALEGAASGRAGRNLAAYEAGTSGVPNAGLGGSDIADLSVTNTQMNNEKILGLGKVKSDQAMARGQFISGLIGAGTSLATAGIGAYGNIGAAGRAGSIANNSVTTYAPGNRPRYTGRLY